MGIMNFPAMWGGGRTQQMCRVADTWEAAPSPEVTHLGTFLNRANIRAVELPVQNLPVKWKPPLPVSPNLPKLAPSVVTAKWFGPQLVIKTRKPQQLFGPVRSATVEDVRRDLGLCDNVGTDDWDVASGEIVIKGTTKDAEVIETGPQQRRFTIQRHPHWADDDIAGKDDLPWYVEEITFGDSRDDYGRTLTHGDAVALIKKMLNSGERHAAFGMEQAS